MQGRLTNPNPPLMSLAGLGKNRVWQAEVAHA